MQQTEIDALTKTNTAFQARLKTLAGAKLTDAQKPLAEMMLESLRLTIQVMPTGSSTTTSKYMDEFLDNLIVSHMACAAWIRAGQPAGSLEAYVMKTNAPVSVSHSLETAVDPEEAMLQAAIAASLGLEVPAAGAGARADPDSKPA